MSVLAGDFGIFSCPASGCILACASFTAIEDGWRGQIEEAYFGGPEGQRFNDLRLWPFFLTLDLHSDLRETDTHFHQSFAIQEGSSLQFVHRGFWALFDPFSRSRPRWRQLLERHSFPFSSSDLRAAAERAYDLGCQRVDEGDAASIPAVPPQ